MAGLMYPAYQKYYSAICNLKRFGIEKDFFNNISSLDNFFSEYRSVTLVMQKALAHTPYLDTYNKVSFGIWDKFFNSQRVKSIHEHPVEFIKKIDVTVYFPNAGLTVLSQEFTVENDVPFSDMIDSLKSFFQGINPVEVFFSANFSFFEKDTGIDLWDKIVTGLETMEEFMNTMYFEIGEKCPLCEKLRSEIEQTKGLSGMRDMLLVADYAYYPQQEIFERAGRVMAFFPQKRDSKPNRFSLDKFLSLPYLNFVDSAFEKFVLLNVSIGTSDLMPTIMTVYQDETYEIDPFHADIKTTMYRKINETAEKIISNEVKEVFVMLTYVVNYDENLITHTSKERIERATREYLVFMKADCELNEEEYVFDGRQISQPQYVAYQIKHRKRNKLGVGMVNMTPIVAAFNKCRHDINKENFDSEK